MKRKTTKIQSQRLDKKPDTDLTFIEHLAELRRRLSVVALFVTGFGLIGYVFQHQITRFLLHPAGSQEFIYTTPGGGIDFLLKVCIYCGLAASIPIATYQLFRFLSPVINEHSRKFIVKASVLSSLLALAGIAFGYFIGLPAAIHFLSRQFSPGENIQALLTLESYLSFVTIYLLGSALLFQIPLVMAFINRIKPLQPRKLMRIQRLVILLAFIAAAIITPTADIFNQTLVAGPIILMYQAGVAGVWLANRSRKDVAELRRRDEQVRLERERVRQQAVVITPVVPKAAPAENHHPQIGLMDRPRFVLS